VTGILTSLSKKLLVARNVQFVRALIGSNLNVSKIQTIMLVWLMHAIGKIKFLRMDNVRVVKNVISQISTTMFA
jgi:hypothetical protein